MPRLAMFAVYERGVILSACNVRTLPLAELFGMCERRGMVTPPELSTLMAPPLNISKGHASEILSGARDRKPSRWLAIRIYRETGWKHPVIASLTDEDIDVLERIESRSVA